MLVLFLLACLACAFLLDAQARPRSRLRRRPAWSLLLAAITFLLLYAFFFALFWRPVFAASCVLVTILCIVLISNYKFQNVHEPLNFADFPLIPQVWRHPLLYQAEFLRHPLFYLVLALSLFVDAIWFIYIEPSLLPHDSAFLSYLFGLLTVAFVIVWLAIGPLPDALISGLRSKMLPVSSVGNARQYGLTASIIAGFIAWRRPTVSHRTWPSVRKPAAGETPLIVVVQSESFVDLKAAGIRDIELPNFHAAKARAAAHGRLVVPVQGAWTLRSEFAFLTGQELSSFGLESLHPYLRLRYSPHTIASHLRDAGFATVFIHPFDLNFFNRDTAIPKLGFERVLGEEDFSGIEPEGYYIPDRAVAERLLALAAHEPRPLFLMAATMENHNPWDERRMPSLPNAGERYMHHLRNADRMIGMLVEGIEKLGRPAIFAFFGDHVPTIRSLADPFIDTRTDYFVMGFRSGGWLSGEDREISLHELADVILHTLGKVSAPNGK